MTTPGSVSSPRRVCGPRAGPCVWPLPGRWSATGSPTKCSRTMASSSRPGSAGEARCSSIGSAETTASCTASPSPPARRPQARSSASTRPCAGTYSTTMDPSPTALDGWVADDYNTRRPHQSLDMASPADRFAPVPLEEREALPLRLPAALAAAPSLPPDPPKPERVLPLPPLAPTPGAVEFDRVVPASGNLSVEGKQFWLGPARAGVTVTFWVDHDVIHLLAGGARLKSVRSHLSTADLARLAATGGRPAGPPPLPAPQSDGSAVEVDRVVNAVGLAGRQVLAAEILAG